MAGVRSACAVVIMAHADAPMVQRLCTSLAGMDLFLHCDARTPAAEFAAMTTSDPHGLHVLPRHRVSRTSWSLVEAELTAIRIALDRSPAEHIVVMSGSCYPLISVTELCDDLAGWRGRSRLRLTPLPHTPWNTPRNRDGGYWRFRRRFLVVGSQTVHVRGVPLRTTRRKLPTELVLHAGAQWKIYARRHARLLLDVLDSRPDLVSFFRHSYIPDESCAGTILRSPALVRDEAEKVMSDAPWYIDWGAADATGSPPWLTAETFPKLRAARTAPRRDPCVLDEHPDRHRKLFARKVGSRERALLDQIDEELRT